jgi:Undecaprenyl-phosphate glucose phosphotransferase
MSGRAPPGRSAFEDQIVNTSVGKQLFAPPQRPRRRPAAPQGRAERLLSGQALAEAQRLSRPRLRPQVFTALLMAAELIVIVVAGALAHLAVPDQRVPSLAAVAGIWVGALAVLAVIRLSGGYRMWRMRLLGPSLQRMSWGLAAGLAVALAVHAVSARIDGAVLVWLALWAVFAGFAMAAARVLVWQRIRALTRLGLLEHRLAVVGGGPALAPILQEFDRCRAEGYRVCGFFDDRADGRSPSVVAGHHKTGDLSDLIAFVRVAQIDTVVVAVPDLTTERQLELLATLSAVPVEVRTLASARLVLPDRVRRSRIGAVNLVELCRPPLTQWQAAQKRAFDIVTASLALVLLAPLMLGVAVAVRLDSPGPILFRQKRHGFNTRPVEVLKFRSMRAEVCDPSGVQAVRAQDDRVTRLGRFLRRSSMDELPQLFNVLSGTLSMVGPRPHATAARTGDILYDEVVQGYSARHKVKPGITGWAQVNGWRGEMNSAEKIRARVEHDLHYAENWSLWFDIRILAMTPRALLSGKNAY